jgi:hypothetical protein
MGNGRLGILCGCGGWGQKAKKNKNKNKTKQTKKGYRQGGLLILLLRWYGSSFGGYHAECMVWSILASGASQQMPIACYVKIIIIIIIITVLPRILL